MRFPFLIRPSAVGKLCYCTSTRAGRWYFVMRDGHAPPPTHSLSPVASCRLLHPGRYVGTWKVLVHKRGGKHCGAKAARLGDARPPVRPPAHLSGHDPSLVTQCAWVFSLSTSAELPRSPHTSPGSNSTGTTSTPRPHHCSVAPSGHPWCGHPLKRVCHFPVVLPICSVLPSHHSLPCVDHRPHHHHSAGSCAALRTGRVPLGTLGSRSLSGGGYVDPSR